MIERQQHRGFKSEKKLTHVWSNKYPLRKDPISKVLVEQSKVLDVRTARSAIRHGQVANQWAIDISLNDVVA